MVSAGEDIIAWQMNHLEAMWTTSDLFSSLGINFNSSIPNSGQFSAGFMVMRVNSRTRNFVDKWDGFMSRNLSLCRDEPSLERNYYLFKENRHDQSAFSLLLKLLISKNQINVKRLSDKDVNSDNLQEHFSPHPPPQVV